MYTLVELWSPKPEYLALSREEREAFFEQLLEKAAVDRMKDGGELVTLGMGRTEPVAHDTGYQWMAVWQGPDKATIDAFLARVEDAGWFEYWEQVHAVSQLTPFEVAIEGQLSA